MDVYNELVSRLEKTSGLSVKEVIAGGSNGSIIGIIIGHEQYSVFVHCTWRLSNGTHVIAGWNDNNDAKVGKLTLGIKSLQGDVVKTFMSTRLGDLAIDFESGKRLDVFADLTHDVHHDYVSENWWFASQRENLSFQINTLHKFQVGKYSESR